MDSVSEYIYWENFTCTASWQTDSVSKLTFWLWVDLQTKWVSWHTDSVSELIYILGEWVDILTLCECIVIQTLWVSWKTDQWRSRMRWSGWSLGWGASWFVWQSRQVWRRSRAGHHPGSSAQPRTEQQTTLQSSRQLYRATDSCIDKQTAVQSNRQLYRATDSCTEQQTAVQSSRQLYRATDNCT